MTVASRPSSTTRASRSRNAAMPAAPCIQAVPGGRSGGSWRCSTNRQKTPASSTDGALEQRVTHDPGGGEQPTGEGWILRVLGRVEKHVADTRRAAAATVVVPEPGTQPSRHPGVEDGPQAPLAQLHHADAVHVLHTGMRQGRKELGCPGGTVAPGVGHRLDLSLRGRNGVRHDEPAVVQRPDGQQVLGAENCGFDQLRSVEGHARDGQRTGDAGRAVGVVGQA